MLKLVLLLLGFIMGFLIELGNTELQQDISLQLERQNGTTLSRKKRYLVFPAGSSFQLVFCLTYPSLGVGSYFVFGHTAALAWELPSTPLYYSIKDYEKKAQEEEDAANAETTTTEIPHDIDLSALGQDHQSDHHRIDSSGIMQADQQYGNAHQKSDTSYSKWPTSSYNRRPVSIYNNPFLDYIKTSGYSTIKKPSYGLDYNERDKNIENSRKINPGHVRGYGKTDHFQRYNYKESQLSSHIDPMYYSIHRRTRRDLYRKIENFLNALNFDGKVCILKALCEVTKSSREKGSFLEEIIKAVFRIKPHDDYPNEDVYDNASNASHNCKEMYPSCEGSVWRNLLLFPK